MPRGTTPVRRQKTPVRNPYEGGDVEVFQPMPSMNTKAGLQAQRAGVKAFDPARVAGRAATPVKDANVMRGRSPAQSGANVRGTTPAGRAAAPPGRGTTPAKKEEDVMPKRRGRPPKDAQSTTPHQMALRERTPAASASRGRSPAVSAAASSGRAASRARTPAARGRSPAVSVSSRASAATGRGRSPATVARNQTVLTATAAMTTRGRSPATATRSQSAARATRGQSQATSATRGKSPANSSTRAKQSASVARGQSPAVARGGRKRQHSENPPAPVAKKRPYDEDELFGGSSESDDASVEMSKPPSRSGLEQDAPVVSAEDVIKGEVDLNRILRLMAHPLNDPAFVSEMMDDLGNLITMLDEKNSAIKKLLDDMK